MASRIQQEAALPSAEQRAAIAGAADGYLLKWNFRLFDDADATSLYNATTLVVLPTGANWKGGCMLVSPYQEVSTGVDRIVFSEFGTRRVDIVGHELQGRVVCESLCRDPPPDKLALCPRATATIALDGLDQRTRRGWHAEVLRGALAKLPADEAEWEYQLDFPRAWLSVNQRTRCEGKIRRGHTADSVPPDEDFRTMGSRLYLDYAVWHGKGAVSLSHASAPGWYFCPSQDGVLSLSGENGGMQVELGVRHA